MKKIAASALFLSMTAIPALAVEQSDIRDTYVKIAQASYGDSLAAARDLNAAIKALIDEPSAQTLNAARMAWKNARVPYLQTEVFRFGNPVIDAWEGRVNAWPLDEGLIDYIADSDSGITDENPFATLNVVATKQFTLSGTEIDASEITPELLSQTLHEADDIEANVATGYHAIEFLLWGQDLNGTEAGSGNRPWTDYARDEQCTGGNCDRRAAYLQAAGDLLVHDLEEIVADWDKDGAAWHFVMDPEAKDAMSIILTGMGSLSYGEVAGERMKLGLMLHDPEEEHDCFSDNTYNSHYYDAMGIRNIYYGRYVRRDGTVVEGSSIADLLSETDPKLAADLDHRISNTMMALGTIKTVAESGMAYDQMIAQGNAAGEALVQGGIDALIDQTHDIERAVSAIGLNNIAFEGSDSLDNPNAVFQ